jgi:simple sugar transport system permease protein
MKDVTQRVVGVLRTEHGPGPVAVGAVVMFVLFSIASPADFPTVLNFQSIGAGQFPETTLLGMGVMVSMLVAGIDLSVAAVADLAGVAMTEYFTAAGVGAQGSSSGMTVLIGVLIALFVGLAAGAVNGLLVGKLGITPILATLATMELYGGLAIAWTGGKPLQDVPTQLLTLANGQPGGIPGPTIVLIICACLMAALLNWTRFGLRAMLLGGNRTAARLSGISELRVQLTAYAASGALAGVAGVIIVARTASATPDYGSSYVLLAVVIAVLAGVDLDGGFGTVLGVVLSGLILAMVQSGFTLLNFSQYSYEVAQGVILLIVLAAAAVLRRRRSSSVRRALASDRKEGTVSADPGIPASGVPQAETEKT